MSDSLQDFINNTTIDLQRQCKVVLLHYLFGPNENPYRTRRTKIYLNSALFSRFAGEIEPQKQHDRVMQEYIQYFDRDNTILNLSVDKFVELSNMEATKAVTTLILNIKTVNKEADVFYLSKPIGVSIDKHIFNITYEISQNSINLLAPLPLVINFFRDIYTNSSLKSTWSIDFEILRTNLFGKVYNIPSDKITNKNISTIDENYFKEENEFWKSLKPIQAALMYFRGVCFQDINYIENDLSGSIVVTKRDNGLPIENYTELAVAVLSPSITPRKIKNSVINPLHQTLGNIGIHREQMSKLPESKIHECLRLLDKKILQDKVKELYPLNFTCVTHATDWTILLTTFLANQKHEGKLLDFFLVCGDLSQIKDSKFTKFREVCGFEEGKSENLDFLSAPSDLNRIEAPEISDRAKGIAKQIIREHYPWFENGSHALFWDTSSGNPVGLVSLEMSNWGQLIQYRFRNRIPFKIPNCLVCYVCGEPQNVGVLLINNPESKSKLLNNSRNESEIKELLRWQEGKWQSMINVARKDELRGVLKDLLNVFENDAQLNEVIEIAIRVSEHPNKGGTIVFVENQETFNRFSKVMGASWKPTDSMTSEDAIALVSQDGATLCPLQSGENFGVLGLDSWEYRKLLVSSGDSLELLNAIRIEWDHITSQKEWPLTAKGSRRWNAAISACNNVINTVLVISQDGDIQVWHVANSNGYELADIERLVIIDFPLEGNKIEFVNRENPFRNSTADV